MSVKKNFDGVPSTSERKEEEKDSEVITEVSSNLRDSENVSSPVQSVVDIKSYTESQLIDDNRSPSISLQSGISIASSSVASTISGIGIRSIHTDGSSTASIESSKVWSGARVMDRKSATSNISKRSTATMKNALEELTNSDLVNTVQELQKNVKHLELENMIIFHFLEKSDPAAIEGMDAAMKNALAMQERVSISARKLTLTRASRRESVFLESSTSLPEMAGMSEKEGPRINITQKTDLVLREMDDIQESLEKMTEKCYRIRHKLKAELEEMSIRENEIKETLKTFKDVFINGIIDKYPQKNPADRFARFMEECFKDSRTIIDKLRLRTSSLKVQYQKICNQLTQKKLLGENLQEVDFEQLQISNKRLVEKIEKRNLLLLELKKMNAHANLLLSRTKKILSKKMQDLQDIKDTIAFREDMVIKLDDESEKVAAELEQTKVEYERIKEKSENYRVPPVLDYVKAKAELGVLKKNLKVWARRKQIKDMALNASIREMKFTTGLLKAKAAWFLHPEGLVDSQEEFEFHFEKAEYGHNKKR